MKQFYSLLHVVFFFSFSHAQIVNIPDANFKNALLNHNVADLDDNGSFESVVDINNDGEIQVSEAQAVFGLNVTSRNISSLEGIEYFVNLEQLFCNNNQLTDLDLSQNVLLETVNCHINQLTSLVIDQNINLNTLTCYDNQLSILDVSQNINLYILSCRNNFITNLDVSQLALLNMFNSSSNQLTNLDVSNNTNLQSFSCSNNQLSSLDVSNQMLLYELNCSNNQITSLDISQNYDLDTFWCNDNELTHLNIKNGRPFSYFYSINFDNNNNLGYLCVNDNNLNQAQSLVGNYGYTNCLINSYCSFVPGGEYYDVLGEVKLDIDNNGCDLTDIDFSDVLFIVTDNVNTGNIFANNSGEYFIPVQEGSHTITPQLENPTYFSISPTDLIVDFPTDTSPYIQNFCVVPNGNYNDLEVSILSMIQARPGLI